MNKLILSFCALMGLKWLNDVQGFMEEKKFNVKFFIFLILFYPGTSLFICQTLGQSWTAFSDQWAAHEIKDSR